MKLVEQGRVVYRESFREQAARADRTWDRYTKWEPSPLVRRLLEPIPGHAQPLRSRRPRKRALS